MAKTLTVFTPAYNRAHTLGRTYESLCRQTSQDFCWLIVDDGSTDNTKALVDQWISEGRIEMRYVYQENQGMHGAHNTAYAHITTELNTCIDSDDYMPDDAVERIVAYWRIHKAPHLAGLMGLDVDTKGCVIGNDFSASPNETTLRAYYQNGGKGDKKIVFRTEVIKQYPPYPLFEGERYVNIASLYRLIDDDYQLLVLNEPLAVVEYQEDGSSRNMYKQYWNNPQGFLYTRTLDLQRFESFKRHMMLSVHYGAHALRAGCPHKIFSSPKPLYTILAFPLSIILYLFTWIQVVRQAKSSL